MKEQILKHTRDWIRDLQKYTTDEYERQIELLLQRFQQWLKANPNDAYISVHHERIIFYVKTEKYDEKLTDKLSNLDVEIANDPGLSLINCNVMESPSPALLSPNVWKFELE